MGRLVELRDELAAVIGDAVPEHVTYARTPDAIIAPAVVVIPASPFATYQRVMGDGTAALFRLEVTVLTGRLNELVAQELLDEWASPDGPILPALYGADLSEAEVVTVTGQQYGAFRFGDASYLGFSLLVEIEA